MIDFVGTPPFLRMGLQVAMVTRHFSHSPNRFILSGPREQFGTNAKLSWGWVGQNRSWGNSNINKLYKRLKMQNWVSFFSSKNVS